MEKRCIPCDDREDCLCRLLRCRDVDWTFMCSLFSTDWMRWLAEACWNMVVIGGMALEPGARLSQHLRGV